MKAIKMQVILLFWISVFSASAQKPYGEAQKINPDSISISVESMQMLLDSIELKPTQFFDHPSTWIRRKKHEKWHTEGKVIGGVYFRKQFFVLNTKMQIGDSNLVVQTVYNSNTFSEWRDIGNAYQPVKIENLRSQYAGCYTVFLHFKKKAGVYKLYGASLDRPGSQPVLKRDEQWHLYSYQFQCGKKHAENKVLDVALATFLHEFELSTTK